MNKQGDRIELDHTDDPFTNLQPGAQGIVTFVDASGTVHVKWNNGSTLGLVFAAGDRWHTVEAS